VQTDTEGGTATADPVYIQSIPNTIDAKDGNNAEQRVIIDGSQIPSSFMPTIGFELDASHCLLRGLIITGFSVGVSVSSPTPTLTNPVVGDLIQGNSIGDYFTYPVDPDTGFPLPAPDTDIFVVGPSNAQGVVLYSPSSNTTIGGCNPQENNIICGNGAQGIQVDPGASGNQILGNQIGIAGPSVGGLYVPDGNGAEGVLIESTGTLTDPQGIDYASSNFVGSATGGNLISDNTGAGVQLVGVGANLNLIQGNYIGVAPGGGYKFGTGDPGNGSDGNGGDGVLIEDGFQNQIGGSSVTLGNTISSNHGAGVYITGVAADPIAGTPATGTGNVVANNMIGVTADGAQVLGNRSDGVALYSPSNTIGPGNVISQNLRGIGIYGPAASTPGNASDNLVVDNLIGTDSTGQEGFGNAYEGIRIDHSADNTIQGNAAGSQVISGNQVGVALIGIQAAGNLLEGNLIGSDNTGKNDLGNKNEGVLIEGAYNNTIGGTTAAALNLISANHWGVRLDGQSATDNLVEGNLIGTDITGKAPLGNELNGVIASNNASENTIGGTVSGAGNTIAFNFLAGVSVESGTGDSILTNSIYSNDQLGIDLVTPSPSPSPPPGPNDLQTAPDLTSAVGGGPSNGIQGTLASIASTPFLIQFFTSLVPDPSGYGQGQTPIGSTTVTTDGQGNAAISFAPSSSLPANIWGTATATNTQTGDTSEFSNALSAQPITMQFMTASLSVDVSAGYAVVQVDRVGNPDATVAVNYATSNGTAFAGQDYTAASGTLTFQPGETDETFSITILPNPSQTASSVTVNLALSQPTGGSTLGSPSTAILTINNNMPPILQFSSSSYTTYTGSSSSLVTVTRGGGSLSTTVQVQYATAGGSAVAGVDYTPVSGTLTFLANQTTATFTVPILQGGVATVTKTIGLVLFGPTGRADWTHEHRHADHPG
jgi:Calx-beta domain